MKFSLEEINQAWIDFNKPLFILDKNKSSFKPSSDGKTIWISEDMMGNIKEITPKREFISYLISWKSNKTKEAK